MQAEGQALLVASGVPAAQITHRRAVEMRYAGQGHEISVPLMDGQLDVTHVAELRAAFENTPLINAEAWQGVAREIKDKLDAYFAQQR